MFGHDGHTLCPRTFTHAWQGEPWTRRFLGKPICTPEQSRLLGTPPSFHAMSTTLEQSSKTLASQYEGYYQDDL
jgi:hypothetical protein